MQGASRENDEAADYGDVMHLSSCCGVEVASPLLQFSQEHGLFNSQELSRRTTLAETTEVLEKPQLLSASPRVEKVASAHTSSGLRFTPRFLRFAPRKRKSPGIAESIQMTEAKRLASLKRTVQDDTTLVLKSRENRCDLGLDLS
jgi:hypothetical protein